MLADAGYNSDTNLAADGPDRLIPTEKGRDHARAAQDPRRAHHRATPRPGRPTLTGCPAPEGRKLYKRRGATVEPGIANLKKVLERFSRRGLGNTTSELHLAATAFNLMKVHRTTAA